MMLRSLITAAALALLLPVAPVWPQAVSTRPATQPPQEHILEYQARPQENVAPSAEIPPPSFAQSPTPPPRTVRRVDEAALWKLLRQQRYTTLRRQIARLRQRHYSWRPPRQLMALLQEGEARQTISQAITQQHWSAVVALASRYPRHFTCKRIDHMWVLADAYHAQGAPGAVLSVYEGIIPGCGNRAYRIATLQKAMERLPADAVETLLSREAQIAKDPEAATRFAEIRYQFYVNRLAAATQEQDATTARSVAERIRADVERTHDSQIATLLGWTYFREHQLTQAGDWFARALAWNAALADAAYGLALTRVGQQDWGDAERIARQWQTASPQLRALLGDVLFARAGNQRQEKDYAGSLALARESEQYRPNQRDTRLLKAWNAYELGQTAQAAEEFAALYQAQPDHESAQGAFYSYARAQEWSHLETLAQSVDGPLRSLWNAHTAQRAYDRKLFLSAARTAPDQFPLLRHIDSPGLLTEMIFREKSGAKGLGKLHVEKLPSFAGTFFPHGVHQLSVRFDRIALQSGRLAENAPIGSFPSTLTAYSVAPTTRLTGGLEPSLTYIRDGWFAPYTELGLTPTEGVVSSKPIWKIGFVQQHTIGNWSMEAFSQPARESLLSYTGIVDPYSGREWGRVRQTGGRISMYQQFNERWGLSNHIFGAALLGKKVEANYHLAYSGSIARNLGLTGFEYLAIGPRVAVDHYKKNLSHFTFGHGGYFSPSHLVQVGLGANFLTAEARQFALSGDISAGFQTHHQESSPFFPHQPDGRRYTASTNSGAVFSTEFTGVFCLSEHWQLNAGFAARKTADYDDLSFMVGVRFLFDPRPGVVSTDIPSVQLQSVY